MPQIKQSHGEASWKKKGRNRVDSMGSILAANASVVVSAPSIERGRLQ